jgi:hypothetical protein
LAGMVYELGYNEVLKLIERPIETNRQIGPLFRNWLENKSLGIDTTNDEAVFLKTDRDMVYVNSDNVLKRVAAENFGYTHEKGLDFMCRKNNKIVLGEAKFLTDFGGHQNAQLADAMGTIGSVIKPTKHKVSVIAILDGVLYIRGRNKMHKAVQSGANIISVLLLRDFLYSL